MVKSRPRYGPLAQLAEQLTLNQRLNRRKLPEKDEFKPKTVGIISVLYQLGP